MSAVNTGTTRIAIVAALIISGIAVLVSGFAKGGGAVALPSGGGSSPTPSLSTGPTHSKSPKPANTLSPSAPADVKVAVYNAAFDQPNSIGIAASVSGKLQNAGYVPAAAPSNGPTAIPKTVVYYSTRGDSAQHQADAQYIADHYLHGAKVQQLGTQYANVVPASADVLIFLGADYLKR